MDIINERVNVFLGLNNQLNPASAEYREGMAYRSKDARIDKSGLWSPRQLLSGCSTAPGLLTGWGSGNHFKNLAVENIDKIISNLASGESVDVGPNDMLYGTTGSGAPKRQRADGSGKADIAVYTPPTSVTATTADGTSTRGENGTYYYMCTYYDNILKRESLPSTVYDAEIDHNDGAKDHISIAYPTATANKRVRIYRTKRTCPAEGVYSATNIFYFIAEQTAVSPHNASPFLDYKHDDDLVSEYEGRGTDPNTATGGAIDYLASFNNRMLYFKGNTVHWSSAGAPDEVAVDYVITYDTDGDTIDCKPKLSLGVYGEAKFEIAELAGQKVVGAMLKDGRLYIWTSSMTGYLRATNRLEGYRFTVVRKGIGLVNDKCLAYTPYGVFGADRVGMWLLDNYGRLRRLSDGVIDIHEGADTTLTQANITDSFIVWIPIFKECWWSVGNVQIAYQADRGVFVGPYTYPISGGTSFVSTGGAQAYLTGGLTPSATSIDTSPTNYYEFWFGQSKPKTIKDNVRVELVHPDSTGTASVTLYQNSLPTETGATAGAAIAYNSDSIGKVVGIGSGRFFKAKLTTTTGRKLIGINYRYNPVMEE